MLHPHRGMYPPRCRHHTHSWEQTALYIHMKLLQIDPCTPFSLTPSHHVSTTDNYRPYYPRQALLRQRRTMPFISLPKPHLPPINRRRRRRRRRRIRRWTPRMADSRRFRAGVLRDVRHHQQLWVFPELLPKRRVGGCAGGDGVVRGHDADHVDECFGGTGGGVV